MAGPHAACQVQVPQPGSQVHRDPAAIGRRLLELSHGGLIRSLCDTDGEIPDR